MTYWGWLLVDITLLLTALSGTQTSLCQRMRSVPVYRGLTYLGGSTDCEGRTDAHHPVRGGHHPPLGERTLPNRPAL